MLQQATYLGMLIAEVLFMPTFGERLKMLRIKKKMLQKEVAAAIGAKRGTVAAWESEAGRLPEVNYIIKLANLFNVSVDYLLGKTDNPIPERAAQEVNLDLETYLQKILSGEIPIHFSGVDRLTPELEDDIRAVLKVALSHIQVQKELTSKKASATAKEVTNQKRIENQEEEEEDEPCSWSGLKFVFNLPFCLSVC